MKIRLSIPRTISSNDSVARPIQAWGDCIHSIQFIRRRVPQVPLQGEW